MKTKFLFFIILLISNAINGQSTQVSNSNQSTSNKPIDEGKDEYAGTKINTSVFKLNLSRPSKKSMMSNNKTKRLSFKSSDLLQFEVVGGNPFKYKYVINNKFINFFEDQFDNPIKSIENTLKNELPKAEETVEETEKVKEEKINELEKLKLKIQANGIQTNKENETVKKNNISTTDIRQAIRDIDEVIDNLNSEYIPSATFSMEYLQREQPKNIEEDKKNVTDAIIEIRKDAAWFVNTLSSYKRSLNSASELYIDNFMKDRLRHKKKSDTIIKNYLNIKRDVQKFTRINEQYEKIETELKSDLTTILNDLSLLYSVKLDNYTLPLDVNGKNIDVVEVTLERFELNSPVATDTYKYNLWVRGGLKIDFSGGIFITSLVNQEYITENRTISENAIDETRQIIRAKEKGNYEFGFGTMINISHRSASWINPTLNVGTLFTVNQQFQVLTGLGAILGKEERVIFSAGLAMGRVARISEAYKPDGVTQYDLGESGVVPTSNQFDFGYYFGITYNFTKNKKQNGSENK